MAAHPLTVGFDLDMTLIDSRPGIKAAYQELSARTGTFVDAEAAVTRLGPPLEQEISRWFPEERVAEISALYRALYPAHAVTATTVMPGAREALDAVHAAGGRAIVVTAKYEPNAKLHLTHLGLAADAVIGDLWAEAKAEALRAHEAQIYVGDHTGDVRGAHTAGALSVAVATGPCAADELRAAGAEVLLADLTDFPSWLKRYVAEGAEGADGADASEVASA
ncbi:phosphoglycolate phosphatase [Streptomyces sp. 2333.5]|uniref:HAD family hydrolase n=1 Tax=unclassified Streptomyces TaxID=2593676 RepID=UPI000895CFFB|nr:MULTISPECIES: haloacid dehalogenase-like hydrolase [unclassified Streptomyces]PJJ03802.1 phosphoglycolate phosphatase [Streptomyces sp. 2333.5]SEE31955.1 phosphoglycolate phosphatase [Streptomyces sp. 2314.4]SEE58821.1 phosphoglycolate phosphatase [Streptomyces sp. 2112.2]